MRSIASVSEAPKHTHSINEPTVPARLWSSRAAAKPVMNSPKRFHISSEARFIKIEDYVGATSELSGVTLIVHRNFWPVLGEPLRRFISFCHCRVENKRGRIPPR